MPSNTTHSSSHTDRRATEDQDDSKTRRSSGHQGGKSDQDDGRRNAAQDRHRDEQGRFVSEDEDESGDRGKMTGSHHDTRGHGGTRGHSDQGDHRGDNAKDQPRDEQGRFVSEEDESAGRGGKSSGHQTSHSRQHMKSGDEDQDGRTGRGDHHKNTSSGHSSGMHKSKDSGEGENAELDTAREKLAEAAREFALERPRDEQGRFISDEEAGIKHD